MKIELTKDQKIVIGCTAVVSAVGVAVVLQDKSTKKRLAETMNKTAEVVDTLDKLVSSIEEGNSQLDAQRTSLIETSKNIADAMRVLTKKGE